MTKATITVHAAALMGGLLAVTDNRGREVPLNVGEDHTITLSEGETLTVKLNAKPERERGDVPAQAQTGGIRSTESTQAAVRDSDNGAQPQVDQGTGSVVADTGPTRTRRSGA